MLFVNLTYRHFDILMSEYGQANKCNASWGCSARTENPVTPQTHLIPWIPLRHPQDTPQTPPDISREVKMSTDNNMTQQTPSNILRQHLIVSEGVWECLFVSVGFCFRLLTSWVPWRCLGVSEGCSGGVSMGIWVVFMEIYSARMCLGVSGFSVLAVWSYNTTMTQPWKKQLFLIWPYWDIKISKCLYIRLTKNIGFCNFLVF